MLRSLPAFSQIPERFKSLSFESAILFSQIALHHVSTRLLTTSSCEQSEESVWGYNTFSIQEKLLI